jgi:hypothetical protein
VTVADVPATPAHLQLFGDWLRSDRPDELFAAGIPAIDTGAPLHTETSSGRRHPTKHSWLSRSM